MIGTESLSESIPTLYRVIVHVVAPARGDEAERGQTVAVRRQRIHGAFPQPVVPSGMSQLWDSPWYWR